MTTTVSITPVIFSISTHLADEQNPSSWRPAKMLIQKMGARQSIEADATAVQSAAFPNGFTHARIVNRGGLLVSVDTGADPAPSATVGIDLGPGEEMILPCGSGQKVGAIEL